jgi:L,D-transpeptidase YcbB
MEIPLRKTTQDVNSLLHRNRGRRVLATCVLAAVVLACGGKATDRTQAQQSDSQAANSQTNTQTAALQRLSPQGAASLQALVETGHLADLRWPDFTDYRVHVKNFYEPVGYALAWVRGGQATPQARAVIALLQNSDSKGLHADDYDGSRWDARIAKLAQTSPAPSEDDLGRFDLSLTVSLMRYISDLHIGKVNPRHFKFGLDIENKKYKLQDLIRERIINGSDVDGELARVEPQFAGYQRNMQALQKYLALARQGDGDPVSAVTKPIKPGDSYATLTQLAKRLQLLGDLPIGADPPETTLYGGALVDAVKHFQERHGLEPDGTLNQQTVQAINVPLSQRVLQLQLALERWRWIPPEFPRPPVVVNIPEFRLRAYADESHVALSMRVVVGRAYRHQTPVFANQMRYVDFRPYWNVPPSIQNAELVPKIRRDRTYLAKHSFEVVNNAGQVVSDGGVSDGVLAGLASGQLRIRQKPGAENALGPVKFLFPNEYDVYLHGTPAQELFSKARRDFSHGCIRVEDPAALAAWVLQGKPEWTAERIKAAMSGSQQVQVSLDKPIPVLIFYSTAFVQPDGEVDFFDDIYGHDTELEQVLSKGYPYPG